MGGGFLRNSSRLAAAGYNFRRLLEWLRLLLSLFLAALAAASDKHNPTLANAVSACLHGRLYPLAPAARSARKYASRSNPNVSAWPVMRIPASACPQSQD